MPFSYMAQRTAAEDELDESPEAVTKEVFKPYQCRCNSILSRGAVPHVGDIAEASSLRSDDATSHASTINVFHGQLPQHQATNTRIWAVAGHSY